MPEPLVETGADSDDSSCGHTPAATKSKLVRFPIDSDDSAFNRCCSDAFFDPVVVSIALPFFISAPPFLLSLDRQRRGSKLVGERCRRKAWFGTTRAAVASVEQLFTLLVK